jgi:hypothetical protein
MGKYRGQNRQRKKAELRQLGVSFEALVQSSLEPGCRWAWTRAEAAPADGALAQRGVRTAKVVQERPECAANRCVAAVDDGLRARLTSSSRC